ncbi:MAG TPA: SDR family oxidoreductase [Gemmataceae bacterium]|nr:SDR family oxidoreductase [Gemmataceae bacterium]
MRLLLTGASGQLGGYLLRELQTFNANVTAWTGERTGQKFGVTWRPVDLANQDHVITAFHEAQPSVVIHAGAVTSVADCYRNPIRAEQVNAKATALLTQLAANVRAKFVFTSTDLVFDGKKGSYREQDPPCPLSEYGRSKVAAEKPVLEYSRGTVVRVSLLYGPTLTGRPSFFDNLVDSLRRGRSIALFEDEWRTPLDLETAAQGIVRIADSDFVGLVHLGGPERLSRLEMGFRLAALIGCDPKAIVVSKRDSVRTGESRPRDVALDSSLWRQLFPTQPWRSWKEAIARLIPK